MQRLDQPLASLRRFAKTIWFFPALLAILLILLTVFKISGSSIGVYYPFFYGNTKKDPALLLDKPRSVRSDEWLVDTQLSLAEVNDHFDRVNHNLGQGEDMSFIVDAPVKDWSEVFRPQNWSFFVLPFAYALAFKWWLLAYLLVVSAYFFILALLPGKKTLAALLSLGLLLSPFVQWWYQYITLGSIYYALFGATAYIYLLRSKKRSTQWWLMAAIAYLMVSLFVVLYPPFQIPCGIVLLAFAIGYLIESERTVPRKDLVRKVGLVGLALLIAGLVSLAFIETRSSAIKATENTVYPGARATLTGGDTLADVFSGNLDFQLQYSAKAADFVNGNRGITNQSESSNFLLLLPFLLLPSVYLLWLDWRKKRQLDWLLLVVNALFLLFALDLFVPHLNLPFRLLLLNRVPHARLLIGLGLLNLVQIVCLVRYLTKLKRPVFGKYWVEGYSLLVLVVELFLDFYTKHLSPGYIGSAKAIAFALPIPIAVYLLLTRRFVWSALVILLFSGAMSLGVNPLYRGTAVLTNNPLSSDIKSLTAKDHGKWITEGIYLENFPLLNGAPSLSGTYAYPQLAQWAQLKNTPQAVYNRYAHVDFVIDQSLSNSGTYLQLAGPDHFNVITNACSNFLRQNDVQFILTTRVITQACVSRVASIGFPTQTLLIYKLN